MDMLTAVEKAKMSKDGGTSGSGAKPKRTLVQRDCVGNKYIDVQLSKMFISSNVSFNLLDNKHFLEIL